MPISQLTDQAQEFIDSVLRLQPQFAAFDCDGTLWAGDAGEGFFSWEFEQGLIAEEIVRRERARYAEYRVGKVSEDEMCGEMVTLHTGLREADVQDAAKQYFEENVAAQIFPEMQELVLRLREAECDVWAVSSTNEWVIRAAMKHFGIPEDKILAAAVRVENGLVTDQLYRLPSGEGKPRIIREVVQRTPDAAFGNSRWDAAMLAFARHPFVINPNSDLEKAARKQGWPVYWPDSVRQ